MRSLIFISDASACPGASPSQWSVADELEAYRALRARCSHDARSAIGAASSMAELALAELAESAIAAPEALIERIDARLRSTLESLSSALAEIDGGLRRSSPRFRVAWTLGLSPEAAPSASESGPWLCVCCSTWEDLEAGLADYRPDAALIDASFARADAGAERDSESHAQRHAERLLKAIRRLGPQRTRISLFGEGGGAVADRLGPSAPFVEFVEGPLSWPAVRARLK